jgi:hypothetical protein
MKVNVMHDFVEKNVWVSCIAKYKTKEQSFFLIFISNTVITLQPIYLEINE